MQIPSWEIDRIAAALDSSMLDLADVYRRTGNEDEYGGGPQMVQVLNDVKCGIAPADFFQFQQLNMAGRQIDITYYSLVFPRGTVIKAGDMVDVFTQQTKVTVLQVERGESLDTMLHVYGQGVEDVSWFPG